MLDSSPPLLAVIVGAILLFAGRRLFWFFVGVVGFLVGMRLALRFPGLEPAWVRWLLAALLGLFGAFLAQVLQRLAVAVVGFFVGGFALLELLSFGPLGDRPGAMLLFLIGGIAAAALAVWLFEGAIIVLSSLIGAGLIVEALDLERVSAGLLLLVLAVLGVAVQMGLTRRGARQPG